MNRPKSEKKQMFLLSSMDPNVKRLGILLLIIFLLASIFKPATFFRGANFQSIGIQLSEYGLMALGCGIAMISGGIDLSCVYVANLCGISAALFMQRFAPSITGIPEAFVMILGCMLALAVGLLCGAFNGFLISCVKIPAMLATLGTYQLYLGIAIILSKGSTVSGAFKAFGCLGGGMMLGVIPIPFVVFLLMAAVFGFVMKKTKLGIHITFVGTNVQAALFSGIRIKSVIIKTYMLSGLASAVAGLISLSRLNSAKADFGSSYTMQCILIVVLGGVNPNGGFGTISGIAIAVVILQTLSSVLNMFPDISNFYRDLIWGVSLIAVLICNYYINNAQRLKKGRRFQPN